MRRFAAVCTLLLLCLAGCSPGRKPIPVTPEAQAIANGYLARVKEVPWLQDIDAWTAAHPGHGAIDTFRASMGERSPVDRFCYQVRIDSGSRHEVVSFFEDGAIDHPRAVIAQAAIYDTASMQQPDLYPQVWQAIVNGLTALYGAPSELPLNERFLGVHTHLPGPPPFAPKVWDAGDKRLALFIDAPRFSPEGKGQYWMLLCRTKALDASTLHEQAVEESYDSIRAALDGNLLREVTDSLRGVPTPFAGIGGERDSGKVSYAQLLECGRFVAGASATGDSVRLPLLVMALHAVAGQYIPLNPGDEMNPTPPAEVDSLARYAIAFEWNPLGSCWMLSKRPLRDVAERYEGTPWGERAFMILQNEGWSDTFVANGNLGPDMAARGERFLTLHPQSRYAAAVLLTIAKAYETTWNISTCKPEEDYLYDPKCRDDEDARLKAIAAFEQVISRHPGSREAEVARVRLPRLKLKVGTWKLDYFVFND